MNAEQQWQDIRDNYLKLIEKNLARVDHPQRAEILNNVREHLANKYAELSPEQQTWESFQQIITEMGPPEEYAELLTEESPPAEQKSFGLNELLAIAFIIMLAIIGLHLIFSAQNRAAQDESPASNKSGFEPDEQVLGNWVSVDLVKTIDDFNPLKKSWGGNLFLQGLDFEPGETVVFSFMTGQRAPNRWSRGEIYYADERPSRYTLKMVNGKEYLFVEWISGDVTVLGQEPWYYVLKKAE